MTLTPHISRLACMGAAEQIERLRDCNCKQIALSGNGPMMQDCQNPSCQYFSPASSTDGRADGLKPDEQDAGQGQVKSHKGNRAGVRSDSGLPSLIQNTTSYVPASESLNSPAGLNSDAESGSLEPGQPLSSEQIEQEIWIKNWEYYLQNI